MARLAAVLILSVLACAPAAAPAPAPAPATAVRTLPPIEREQLRADVFAFAHDSMRGRRSGTGYDVRAASYIVQQLQGLGLEPAGDSGYFHRVPLTELRAGPGSVVRVLEGQRVSDVPLGTVAPLRQLGPDMFTRLEASGELMFGAYGIPIPQLNRNDLRGQNLSGRIVVMINGGPAGLDSAQRATYESQQAFGQRLQLLIQGGAAGIIMLFTGEFGDQIRSAMPQLLESISLREEEREVQRALPLILIGHLDDAPPALLPAGWPQNDAAGLLTGRRLEARIVEQRRHFTSYNVVGVLRGADPAHNRSYVALGAHLDHIGVVQPQNGDSIANGADDNASGSMALVAIARSVSRMEPRPRRSLLFVWHTAEEEGLLGAQHFTTQPIMPIDSIVAQINADMIGRNHPDSLYIVGPRAAPGRQSAVLGGIADSVNASLGRPFFFNREWDDPGHPEQIYVRSDHYAYAQQGIPVVFFTTGLHDDYHAVTDRAELIDYDKLARVTDYIMRLAIAVADRPSRLRPAR
jgi:hypothetical protein